LAKAEATQTATRAGKSIGMLAGAALGGYFVLLFFGSRMVGSGRGHRTRLVGVDGHAYLG
jgi:hypothetical protein